MSIPNPASMNPRTKPSPATATPVKKSWMKDRFVVVFVHYDKERNKHVIVTHVHDVPFSASTIEEMDVAGDPEAVEAAYLQGVSKVLTARPELSGAVIYLGGVASRKVQSPFRESFKNTSLTVERLSSKMYYKNVRSHVADTAVRELLDTGFDPNPPQTKAPEKQPVVEEPTTPRKFTVHIYSDTSKSGLYAKSKGYGHGYVFYAEGNSAVYCHSEWMMTSRSYDSNQFEFAGMLTATKVVTQKYLRRMTRDDMLDVVVHCDNMKAVQIFNDLLNAETFAERQKIAIHHLKSHDRALTNNDMFSSQVNVKAAWVKGHNGNSFNETADQLAVAARKRWNQGIDKDAYHQQVTSAVHQLTDAPVKSLSVKGALGETLLGTISERSMVSC